jgi:hypothetical protein
MHNDRFDSFTRTMASSSSRRQAVKRFLGLVTGAAAWTVSSKSVTATDTVTICHQPGTAAEETTAVDAPAVDAHLAHGDYLGPCCLPEEHRCVDDSGTGAGTCCLETQSCNPAGGCCKGLGTVPDGGFCSGLQFDADAQCCSGACNTYSNTCFSGCIDLLKPSDDDNECCSGYRYSPQDGSPFYCAEFGCQPGGATTDNAADCCSQSWDPDTNSCSRLPI